MEKDIGRLRFEMSDVYRLFTENDNKIVEDYINTKTKQDGDIAMFKTQIGIFDNEIKTMRNMMEDHTVTVDFNKRRIGTLSTELTSMKQACMELA